MKKISISTACILLLLAVLVSCSPKKEEDLEKKLSRVSVIKAQLTENISSKLHYSGKILPIQHTVITSLVNGIVFYLVPVGQNVNVGEQLFLLNDSTIETNFLSSQITLNNALQNFQQTEHIASENVIQAELGLNSAGANLRLAESNLEITKSQSQQSVHSAESSTLTAYATAFTAMGQTLSLLSRGQFNNSDHYIYKDTISANSTLRYEAQNQMSMSGGRFLELAPAPSLENIVESLDNIERVITEIKKAVDLTVLVLQDAQNIESNTHLEDDHARLVNQQNIINQNVNGIIMARSAYISALLNAQSLEDRTQNQLEVAKISFENASTSLASSKRSSELQVIISKNGLHSAQTQNDISSIQYYHLGLTAPFQGTVTRQFIEVGDQVRPGDEMVELGNLNGISIILSLSASQAENLVIGQRVMIKDNLVGIIKSIQPVADLDTGKVEMKIEADNTNGQFAIGDITDIQIDLNYTVAPAIFIPLKAVTIGQVDNFVFTLKENNVLEKRIVTLGKVYGQQVEITDGLEDGDRVVTTSGSNIIEGEEVEVME